MITTKLYSVIDKHRTCCYTIIHSLELYPTELSRLARILGASNINPFLESRIVCEIGPKNTFKTTWNTNMIEILRRISMINIVSIEQSTLYIDTQYCDSYDPILFEDYTKRKPISHIKTRYVDKAVLCDLGDAEFEYYNAIFAKRKMTNVEECDIRQSNSEHSRHWFFNGNYQYENNVYPISLMEYIKSTNVDSYNSIIAFADNASCIMGYHTQYLNRDSYNCIYKERVVLYPTHTAETHNFPTSISPFSGANTGVGGRIRDTIALGKGSNFISGYCGYCVGNIDDTNTNNYPYCTPTELLIQASDGASDYGNKIGEPIVLGFTRSFGQIIDNTRFEYVKPIMYCGGIGSVLEYNLYKDHGELGMLLCQVGGPAYNIGLGGGSASSNNQSDQNKSKDFTAVQRGDPYMANKLCRFVRRCSDRGNLNPMLSIHDQGSGGMGNVLKELADTNGALISLDAVNVGDAGMTSCEIWCAEYQEQCAFLTTPSHIEILKRIATEENVPLRFVGVLTNTKEIVVLNNKDIISTPARFPTDTSIPIKQYKLTKPTNIPCVHSYDLSLHKNDFLHLLSKVLSDIDVGCKKFLTNKVDRSVSGLIAQQQCIGPHHTPLSNYSLTKLSFDDYKGVTASIGERPYIGLINVENMVNMALGEMLTNLIFVKIERFRNITVLGNWMWSNNIEGGEYLLHKAALKLTETLKILNIGIDGGKDSLSMNTDYNNEKILSPNSVVLSSYVICDNIYTKLTPEFKKVGSTIIYIPLSDKKRMGGSILMKTMNKLTHYESPDFENIEKFESIFNTLQIYLSHGLLSAGHDVSDGGLITTLIEMCISSEHGCDINITSETDELYSYMFNEELGLVFEISDEYMHRFKQFASNTIEYLIIGKVTNNNTFKFVFNDTLILNEPKCKLLDIWQSQCQKLELLQCDKSCVKQEYSTKPDFKPPKYVYNDIINIYDNSPIEKFKYSVIVLREEGSNGDKELIACFHDSGFQVYEMNMTMLANNVSILSKSRGIAFCGGFSFSDTLGSATGWSIAIKNNIQLNDAFTKFYKRHDTFSIGICNGCQLMSKMGWVPDLNLEVNDSGRFESRYCNIKVNPDSNCIFTKGLEGVVFGMWCAHKEGKMITANTRPLLTYCNNNGKTTNNYPENPNGSKYGCAGVCSADGRHLALMPHPERSYYKWQLPWVPSDYDVKSNYTPWRQLFINAYKWSDSN